MPLARSGARAYNGKMRLSRRASVLAWTAVLAGGFGAGLGLELITLKSLVVIGLGIAAIIIILLPYRLALCALIFIVGVEGMAKLLSNYNPAVHLASDLLVGALCARVLLSLLLKRVSWPKTFPPYTKLFIAHFVWFGIAFFNPYALGTVASLAGMKLYFTMFLLFFFTYYVVDSRKTVHLLMAFWMLDLAIQVGTTLYQASRGPSSVLWLAPGYGSALKKFEGNAFRPFGTTATPGGAAVHIFLVAPFITYFLTQSKSMLVRGISAALAPLTVLALLFCQIRSALLKAILSTGIFLVSSFGKVSTRARVGMTAATVAGGLLIAFLVPHLTERFVSDQSDNARAVHRTLTLFSDDAITRARPGALNRILTYAELTPLGAGLSRTGAASGKFGDLIARDPYFSRPFFTDNFWAASIVDLGIPGALILTTLILLLFARGLNDLRKMKDPGLASTQAVLLGALFATTSGFWGAEGPIYNPEAAFYWMFFGALMKLPALDRQDSSSI